MNRVKKMVALALAAMVVLGTSAGLNVQTAFAESPKVSSVKVSPTTFDNTTKLNFVVNVNHVDASVPVNAMKDLSKVKVTLDSSSDFEEYSTSSAAFKVDSATGDVTVNKVEYRAVLNGLKLKTGKTPTDENKLVFKVEDTNTASPYTATITATVKSDSSSGGGETPPEVNKSNANYTITKVSVGQRINGIDKPGKVKFDIDKVTTSSDATIRQTYFVDMIIRVNDGNAPDGLIDSDVQLTKDSDGNATTTEMGSFVFDPVAGSKVTMVNSVAGSYELKFTALRYTGNGKKLNFRVKAADYTCDVLVDSISECKTRLEQQQENNNNQDDDDDDTIVEAETPYVIVSKYSYGGGLVNAGQTFPLSLTFYNTSSDLRVTNMMITLTMPDGLMLTNSSNTFYVDELGTKSSITKSVQVTARPDAKVQSHNVGIAMKYQYVDPKANARRSAETSETVAIPLAQVDRFDLTSVEIPMEIVLEEENNVTVQFVNKGRSEVYNLTASIEGDILNPGQQQNLGNLASGATGSADFTLKANQAGPLRGTISVTYEDTNMEEKTATIEYFTEVKTLEEMNGGGGMFPGMDPGMDPSMEPGMGDPAAGEKSKLPIYLGIGGAVVLVAAVIVYKQVKRRRKEKEDADL